MEKNVLFFANTYMGIYADIIRGLEQQNFEVCWIKDPSFPGNPYNKREQSHKVNKEKYALMTKAFWEKMLNEYNQCFDYFFAIDGLNVNPYLFDELRKRNPQIECKLYLYDKIDGNYEINEFFQFYDDIYTFEIEDSEKYGFHLLPIFWVPYPVEKEVKYAVLGLTSLKSERQFDVFSQIRNCVREKGLTDIIKLYHSPVSNRFLYKVKCFIKKILGRRYIPLKMLDDDIVINYPIPTEQFRKLISESEVILDTHDVFQDGLTARFMWALGAGKKIITTNSAVKKYAFYSKEQFFILDDSPVMKDVADFIKRPFIPSKKNITLVEMCRINNWIRTIFSNSEKIIWLKK